MQSRRVRMIALDLDGTTLNSAHEISAKTVEVLRRVSEKGIVVCIATGRSIATVTKYVDEINLPVSVPVICFNGSIGFSCKAHTPEHTLLFSNPMSEVACRDVISFAERHGCVAQYYNGLTGEILAAPKSQEHRDLMRQYADLVGHEQTVVDSYAEIIKQTPTAKLLVLTPDPEGLIDKAKKELKEGAYNVILGSHYFVEFLESNMSKGAGLLKMSKCLG